MRPKRPRNPDLNQLATRIVREATAERTTQPQEPERGECAPPHPPASRPVALHFAFYNFVRRHQTLKTTPAYEAG
jgi:hypothetical protein